MPVSIKQLKPGSLVKILGDFVLYVRSLDSHGMRPGDNNAHFPCPKGSIVLLLEAPHELAINKSSHYSHEGKFLNDDKIGYMYLKREDDGIALVVK